ncbi:hypothetical protein [Glaesserella parasuis]|uniref:hypothetical protein n=1 Tax=Glaesserella parasuis TaxID=738 RepID=UPI00131A0012|nr:hypothetical protein [Glaesserella parasuis]
MKAALLISALLRKQVYYSLQVITKQGLFVSFQIFIQGYQMFNFRKQKQQVELIEQLQAEIEELKAENYRLRDLLSREWQEKRRFMKMINGKKKK